MKQDIKTKKVKAPHEDSRMTLKAIHEKEIYKFRNEISSLDSKKDLLSEYKLKLKIVKDINEIHDLNNKISLLEKDIENISNMTDYSEYLLKSIDYISEYENSTVNRGSLSKKYINECLGNMLNNTRFNKELDNIDELICEDCNTTRIINQKEALATCVECGSTIPFQDNDLCIEFSDEIEVLSPYAYKRINHFKECLSMLLAKENSNVPQNVIDDVLLELKKNRIYDKSKITHEKVKQILRKKGHNKHYDHVPSIIYKISGIEPPKISKELENKLIEMFEKMQTPFEMFKPNDRKNFINYSYCIHKCLQILLGPQNHLLIYLPLLKNREKLYAQDQLFKKICKYLDWPFYKSC